jgi:hypothetical protein
LTGVSSSDHGLNFPAGECLLKKKASSTFLADRTTKPNLVLVGGSCNCFLLDRVIEMSLCVIVLEEDETGCN